MSETRVEYERRHWNVDGSEGKTIWVCRTSVASPGCEEPGDAWTGMSQTGAHFCARCSRAGSWLNMLLVRPNQTCGECGAGCPIHMAWCSKCASSSDGKGGE